MRKLSFDDCRTIIYTPVINAPPCDCFNLSSREVTKFISMESPESLPIILAILWSLAAVAVGLGCGFFIGRFFTLQHESKKITDDRARTLTALMKLIESTDQLNQDVDQHNSALATAQAEINSVHAGDRETIQQALISGIAKVMESNRKLENDLVLSRHKLESQAQELDKTRHEARTDSLCQVGNRKAVEERLDFMFSKFRSDRKTFGLMLIDVDYFKRINDTFGHQAGDEVLTSISEVLKQCVRPHDFVGRLGGDEFIILLDNLSPDNVDAVGNRIRETVEKYNFSLNDKGHSTVVTLSMGLTIISEADSAESSYKRADEALYRSKELGRNRLSIIVEEKMELGQFSNHNSAHPKPPMITDYQEFKKKFFAEL